MKKWILVLATLGSFALANEIPPSYGSEYENDSRFGFSSREVDNDLTFTNNVLPKAPSLAPMLGENNITVRETNITVRWGLSKYILKQTIRIRDVNTSDDLTSTVDIGGNGLTYSTFGRGYDGSGDNNDINTSIAQDTNNDGMLDSSEGDLTTLLTIPHLVAGTDYNITITGYDRWDNNFSTTKLFTTPNDAFTWTDLTRSAWNMVSVPTGKEVNLDLLNIRRDHNITNIWTYSNGEWNNGYGTSENNKTLTWDVGIWIKTGALVSSINSSNFGDINITGASNIIAVQNGNDAEFQAEQTRQGDKPVTTSGSGAVSNFDSMIAYFAGSAVTNNQWVLMGLPHTNNNGTQYQLSTSGDESIVHQIILKQTGSRLTTCNIDIYYYNPQDQVWHYGSWDNNTVVATNPFVIPENHAIWFKKEDCD